MNRLIRQAYGRSGSRLDGVFVSTPPIAPSDSLWLRFAMALLWVVIAIGFSRYTQTGVVGKDTVIDISQLADTPKLIEPEIPKLPLVPPVEKIQPPPVQIIEPPPARSSKNMPEPPTAPQVEEIKPPTITRSSPASRGFEPPAPVRTIRERLATADIATDTQTQRIAREASPRTAEFEARGERKVREIDTPLSVPAERVVIRRPQVNGETVPKESVASRRQLSRQQLDTENNPATSAARIERTASVNSNMPKSTAQSRGRDRLSATVADGDGAGRGKVAGVPFQSLDVCPNVRDEEENIRKVLSVVGGRSSCGEYRFTGTNRISSFNMQIDTTKGRRLLNRCEELDNAFNCLKNNR